MIITNMVKAKEIAHGFRRVKRDTDFKPLDIQSTIPAKAVQAEKDRQAIRDVDAGTQIDIDNTSDEASLKAILVANRLV